MVCAHLVQTPGKTAGCIIWTGEDKMWIIKDNAKEWAELDVNWNMDLNVKVYLRSRMVESSEESLLGSHESKCCWCPAESRNMWFVWRNSSLKINLLHPWESDIQNRCEKFNNKTWAEILNKASKRYPAEESRPCVICHGRTGAYWMQKREPEGSKYYTGVKFFKKCSRP